jgi:hypothetical protein
MRIRFERSGGFANIPLRAELDSDQMPRVRAQELERLVERAHLFDQPAEISQAAATPDDFQYKMTVEDGGRSHALRTSDTAAPDDLKLLFDFLAEEALRKLKGDPKS